MATYTYSEAVEQTITAGEQIHQIVNGTATTEVTVEDGSKVPSIRKALLDNFYFKDPIAWQVGQTENVFNQLRQFTDGSWWYAPSATASNPISMGSTPVGDPLWKVYDFDAIGKLTPQIREALRRSYAEAGYNVVAGSFEVGGTLVNANDVLLQERTGNGFSGPVGTVAPGTNPAGGGFVDRSAETLRHKLALNTGAGMVATADGRTVQERFDTIPALISQHNSSAAAHPALSAFISAEADRAETAADSVKPYVDDALSNLSTAANKFYPTLAMANADIANILVNQPITVGEAVNGGLWYKATSGATSLTKSPYDPLTQAKSYSESQRKLGENNVTQMWFINPYYEHSGNTLYFKPSLYMTTDNCFYVRDKRYPPDTITRTKFWDDLSTQIAPTKFKVTSPSGVTDCIALSGFEALLYDHVNKKIVLGARDTVGDYTVLIAMNGNQIGACLEEDKIISQVTKQELQKDTITVAKEITRLGENNVTQMWFINPHYEHSGNTLYFKPSLFSTTDNCFYVRDKRYPQDTITRTKFWADLEAQVTPARFKVTSPSGVADCVGLIDTEALLYDHLNKKIVLGERTTVGNYTCLVANNFTEVGACLEEAKIRDQVLARQLRSEIPDVSEQRQVSSTYKIKGIAHRGYSTEAPENTLPAYVLAKTKGFEYVECDIGFTSDSVPVLLHDETINRTSTGTGTLSEMTLAQVKAFDYGSWKNAKYAGTQIPTLEEFLKLCRNLGLHPYLEIKNVPSATQDRVESVVAIVNSLGMKGKVSYISFDVNILRWIKAVDGTARLGLVGGGGESSANLALSLKTSANDVFVDGGYTDVTEARVLYAISKNLGFEVWTVNDPALVRGLADMGVTGITTDGLDIDAIIAASYT